MSTATLTSKGQLTLPSEVRTALRLKAGDKVRFEPMADGAYRLVAKRGDITELRGFLAGRVARPVSIAEMDEAIAEAVIERDARSRY